MVRGVLDFGMGTSQLLVNAAVVRSVWTVQNGKHGFVGTLRFCKGVGNAAMPDGLGIRRIGAEQGRHHNCRAGDSHAAHLDSDLKSALFIDKERNARGNGPSSK